MALSLFKAVVHVVQNTSFCDQNLLGVVLLHQDFLMDEWVCSSAISSSGIALAIVVGVGLGAWFPDAAASIAVLEAAGINLPIAVLIWGMIFPMMLAVDFSSIGAIRQQPRGLLVTAVVNWLIKPFTMTALAWLFIRGVFSAWIPAAIGQEYVAGMILLGVAPCTAMVFVWSRLSDGDPNYTLVQVALNDLIMVFAFAPIAALLLGVSDVLVPWDTMLTAVGLFVVVPLVAGWFTRLSLRSARRIERLETRLKPPVDWRVDRHRVAAVHGAGPGDPGQSAGHRFDCHPFNPSDLSDLLDHSVLDALSRAATIDCGTRGHDRRVQLF